MKKSYLSVILEELSSEEIAELREKEEFQEAYLKELEKIEDEVEELEELSSEEIAELREKEEFQEAYLKELEKIEDEVEEFQKKGDKMIDKSETIDEQQWNAHFAFLQKCSQEERQVSIVLKEYQE